MLRPATNLANASGASAESMAFFDPNDIQNEIERMSSKFGRPARIIQMPQREELPNAVIAIWGVIQLEPLIPEEISILASGGSHLGILVSFLSDLRRSAKEGVPVYRLAGGAGFLWAANVRSERKRSAPVFGD